MFIFANYIGTIIPIFVIGLKKFRTINNIFFSAIIVVLALWVNRYLIIIPTLETPYLPIQDYRPDWIHYSPTWVEWSLTAAGVAVFSMLLMLFSKFIPIISISEMSEPEETLEKSSTKE